MRFSLDQRVAGPVDLVMAVFLEPGYYADLGRLPNLGAPDLLEQRRDGDVVVQRVRYRFTGNLSGAARAALDPERLTWVEESTYDLARRAAQFRLVPDHYADRFRCTGATMYAPAGDSPPVTLRRVEGDLSVRVALVGRTVERAIVGGLRDHLAAEVPVLERWVALLGGP